MDDVAVVIKMFSRVSRLGDLLDSIEGSGIKTVYIADDGPEMAEKSRLYEQDFPFELNVLKTEVDSGVGHGRRMLVEESSERYLLMVDSDNLLPQNVHVLRDILDANGELGGVCGNLLEDNRITGSCHHLIEEGDRLIRDVRRDQGPELVGNHPVIPFDYLQNVTMFRRDCVEEYSWDPEHRMGYAHVDFYVGHMRQTDWKFACCPSVLFPHNPGGNTYYSQNRHDQRKLTESRQYFFEKWGYDQILWRDVYPDSYRHGPVVAYQYLFKHFPVSVHNRMWNLWQKRLRHWL